MVGDLDTSAEQQSDPEQALAELERARTRTLSLIAHLRPCELEASHSPIMSPLVWDLAHIAAYEDLWLVHRHGGDPLLHPELAALYDAFETPRALRSEIELLDATRAVALMAEVRERSERVARQRGVGDGFLHEMVCRHELQHTETMLQTMAIAGLLPPREVIDPTVAREHERPREIDESASEWVELAEGSFSIGALRNGFAYDNERPQHQVRLDPFAIATSPVSNREWGRFRDDGGYERREHWSAEGWAWLSEAEPTVHPAAGVGEDAQPVCHVSFHEAEAFCDWRGARLPTEQEWEAASRRAGDRLGGRRQVWEWTSSELAPYPGFVAHPYREYSEVFFGKGYRVLRGGSWATHERVASVTFRNWDLPVRRQIFAGLRLATDI